LNRALIEIGKPWLRVRRAAIQRQANFTLLMDDK
jgi:hypothetical protein